MRGGGLIAGAQRIDDAEPARLAREIGADGDVGLDIHHDEVLAVLHGGEADLGADRGLAGGVDHHVDVIVTCRRAAHPA